MSPLFPHDANAEEQDEHPQLTPEQTAQASLAFQGRGMTPETKAAGGVKRRNKESTQH